MAKLLKTRLTRYTEPYFNFKSILTHFKQVIKMEIIDERKNEIPLVFDSLNVGDVFEFDNKAYEDEEGFFIKVNYEKEKNSVSLKDGAIMQAGAISPVTKLNAKLTIQDK